MKPTFKEITEFFDREGASRVSHTEKTYLAHAIGVYNDLKRWGFDEEIAQVGLFHSIYGTQIFQGFTLPLERRDDVRALIGERAERLAYLNCALDRPSFDNQVTCCEATYFIIDRFSEETVEVDEETFTDLVNVHLCDWLEQVGRSRKWDYRRQAYGDMARRLGGIALESFERAYAGH